MSKTPIKQTFVIILAGSVRFRSDSEKTVREYAGNYAASGDKCEIARIIAEVEPVARFIEKP